MGCALVSLPGEARSGRSMGWMGSAAPQSRWLPIRTFVMKPCPPDSASGLPGRRGSSDEGKRAVAAQFSRRRVGWLVSGRECECARER